MARLETKFDYWTLFYCPKHKRQYFSPLVHFYYFHSPIPAPADAAIKETPYLSILAQREISKDNHGEA